MGYYVQKLMDESTDRKAIYTRRDCQWTEAKNGIISHFLISLFNRRQNIIEASKINQIKKLTLENNILIKDLSTYQLTCIIIMTFEPSR